MKKPTNPNTKVVHLSNFKKAVRKAVFKKAVCETIPRRSKRTGKTIPNDFTPPTAA